MSRYPNDGGLGLPSWAWFTIKQIPRDSNKNVRIVTKPPQLPAFIAHDFLSSPHESPRSGATVLDYTSFPHIIDQILASAPIASLMVLRDTSRYFRTRVDTGLVSHSKIEPNGQWLEATKAPIRIAWDDPRSWHITVLDTTIAALHAAPYPQTLTSIRPKVLRFDLLGVLPGPSINWGKSTIRAPTAVIFVAPHMLSSPVTIPRLGGIRVSDQPGTPQALEWYGAWTSHGWIPPSIIELDGVEKVATQRMVYNFRVHPDHAAFALCELDFISDCCPDDIYVLFTLDTSPLPSAHAVPANLLQAAEGQILNRMILSLARHIVRNWKGGDNSVRVHFVAAETWNHAWLGRSFIDKEAYIDVDEDGLPENVSMAQRLQFWMAEAFESQYLHDTTAVELATLSERTKFISMDEFRAAIGDDEVFAHVLQP